MTVEMMSFLAFPVIAIVKSTAYTWREQVIYSPWNVSMMASSTYVSSPETAIRKHKTEIIEPWRSPFSTPKQLETATPFIPWYPDRQESFSGNEWDFLHILRVLRGHFCEIPLSVCFFRHSPTSMVDLPLLKGLWCRGKKCLSLRSCCSLLLIILSNVLDITRVRAIGR